MLSKDQTILFAILLPFAYIAMIFHWIVVTVQLLYIIIALPLTLLVLYASYIVLKNIRYHFPKVKI